MPRAAKHAPRWRRRALIALLIALGVAAGAAMTLVVGYRWFERRAAPGQGDAVAVSWPEGLDDAEAAALLLDLGLTDNAPAMEAVLRVTDAALCIVPGPHLLPSRATPAALVAALCRSDSRPRVKVTLVEGFHRFTIADRLEQKGIVARQAFLHATADLSLLYRLGIEPGASAEADNAEGFLFPATYELPIDSEPSLVVTRLVEEAERRWQRLVTRHAAGWEKLQSELDFDRRAVITLASMVEKETGDGAERPTIASVFLNRLRDPAFPHLQSDPTAMYGCRAIGERIEACRNFDGKASGAINRDRDNVYSTYVTQGLPPGPIANPGDASIEAVLAPADTRYRFFVAKGGGAHTFSESYDDHLTAVQRLRELRAR